MQNETSKQALNKMIKARTHFLFDNPFIGSQAIKYELIPTENYKGMEVKTAATNGKVIVFNPDYINELTMEQVKFLIAHETFHNILKHNLRRSGRDQKIWNYAGDYAINDILIDEDIGKIKDGFLFDSKYHGMDTETIYKDLDTEAKQDQNQSNDNQDSNDQSQNDNPESNNNQSSDDNQGNDDADSSKSASPDMDEDDKVDSGSNGETDNSDNDDFIADNPAGSVFDADLDENETIADIESDLKETIQSAMAAAKRAGKMPGMAIQKIVSDILAPKANWKEQLQNWLDSTDKTDMSFIRLRQSENGFYMPGYYNESLNQLIIAIDVSGSVLGVPKSIESFQAEINEMRLAYQFDCTLIYFHSYIERIEKYQRFEKIEIEVRETGGTEVKPVFDYIQDNGLNNQISGLIVFTDLEICDFPLNDPVFKTLWVKYGKSPYIKNAPIGETIEID